HDQLGRGQSLPGRKVTTQPLPGALPDRLCREEVCVDRTIRSERLDQAAGLLLMTRSSVRHTPDDGLRPRGIHRTRVLLCCVHIRLSGVPEVRVPALFGRLAMAG